ncbi:Mitochondrial distribution and morphology protein 10 [Coemansia sp. IMI 203386]|nr:Mitochondrial distribution and morphology protein 10 [Coemansia sp. IMI 203386]
MFTAPDYFPFLIRQFHRQTWWDEHNSYSTFCKTSQEIIDFAIPRGVSVSTGRSISNGLSSQLVFSMIPSKASSVGYLAASRPLFATSPPASASALGFSVNPESTGTTGIIYVGDLMKEYGVTSRSEQSLFQTDALSLPARLPTNSEVVESPRREGHELTEKKLPELAKGQEAAYSQRYSQDLLDSIRAGVWKCNWDIGSPDARSESDHKDYLMVAQMYPSLSSITGSYIKRRSPTSELTISGVSVAGAHPDIQLILQHAINKRRWSSETILASSGKLIGLRSQYNFGNVEALDRAAYTYYCGSDEDARRVLHERVHGRLSVGTEVYFGAQDSSGGISVGARYRYDLPLFSELTCVLNPIMGHLSLAWSQQLRPQFCASARYDFNMFSLNSELAAGVEWQMDQNSIVKIGWSGPQGLRFLVDTRLKNMVFTMGLAFNSGNSSSIGSGTGANTSNTRSVSPAVGAKQLVKSFGLQFQWFL